MPPGVPQAILAFIESLKTGGKIGDKIYYTEDVVQRLGTIRAELYDETIRVFNITAQRDYFLELVDKHLNSKKY